jgi:hypothetical protein
LWTFQLPGLAQRPEDIQPNLNYELDRFAERHNTRVTFNKEIPGQVRFELERCEPKGQPANMVNGAVGSISLP